LFTIKQLFSTPHLLRRLFSMASPYETACTEVKEAGAWHTTIPNERKLISYGLFKQINSGNNTGSRPWAIQFEACAKFDAWLARADTTKEECMQLYVDEWAKQKEEFKPK
jgi:acyl-CoA-binding protein